MKGIKYILKGRQAILPNLIVYDISTVLVITLLVTITPAFYSCSKQENASPGKGTMHRVSINVKSIPGMPGSVDIFFFNDDRLRRLDSYMRTDISGTLEAASREGAKIMSIIANSPLLEDECCKIHTYEDLEAMYTELKDETTDSPVMSAERKVNAGHENHCSITLEPIMSKVRINSISCDFHGKPYKGRTLANVKIYLTNVCSRFPLSGKGPKTPECIINHGHLSKEDIAVFKDPGMIFREIDTNIGETVLFPDIDLYCYPNMCDEEGLGASFTRLVIEGTLDGAVTYYPIDINRGDWSSLDNKGVGRNSAYIYDITITRRGTSSPDIPIAICDAGCTFTARPWNMAEDRVIEY